MTFLAFLSFGFTEILIVGFVALLVFGGDLPDVMRSVGRSYARLRRSMQDLSRPVREEMNKLTELPTTPPPHVGPPTSNPPVPEYLEGKLTPDEEMTDPGEPPREESPSSGGVADEPPPV